MGGFGAAVLESFTRKNINLETVACLGIPDRFIEHGNRDILLDQIGLSPEKIAQTARQLFQGVPKKARALTTNGKAKLKATAQV